MSKPIDGRSYQAMIQQATLCMQAHRQRANELNVFPVPDGDTGTNMSMTMMAAQEAVGSMAEPTLHDAAEATASAMLRGARGNSGVILSLLFRGIAKKLKDKQSVGGADVAVALREGVDTAYKAVMKPAEGTILTVSRCAAQKAVERCQQDPNCTVAEILHIFTKEGEKTLAETQFQNPVLKKAGVVDAGGYGLVEIFRGLEAAFCGTEVDLPAAKTTAPAQAYKTEKEIPTDGEIRFAYCTEFIAERQDASRSPERLRELLNRLGDSLVVVEDDKIIKVHVHTNEPDKVLAEGLRFGQLNSVKIENMRQQHSSRLVEEAAQCMAQRVIAAPEKEFGLVSICAGDGIAQLFREDLGVDEIVSGGQSMNPSTSDILKAIDAVPAKVVYVLPNNKNIWMAAQQAVPLAGEKKVVILETATVPQGISALLSFDPDATEAQNTEAMQEAMTRVHSGAITYAARNSEFDGKRIREGEYLALLEGKLCANTRKLPDAYKRLAKEMTRRMGGSYLTILYGEGVEESEAHLLEEAFLKECPQLETTVLRGGQPVYYFLVSVE